jgi:hypothetical protein
VQLRDRALLGSEIREASRGRYSRRGSCRPAWTATCKSAVYSATHFLFQLRAGTVVAEQFDGSGSDPNRLVARRGGSTYAWQAAGKCWRRVPPADPRTLTEVGLAYPYPRTGVKTMRPRRHWADVILTTEDSDEVWFLATQNVFRRTAKRIVTYTGDAHTDRIRSIHIQAIKDGTKDIRPHPNSPAHWWTATVHVTTLTSRPRLPTAVPTCSK